MIFVNNRIDSSTPHHPHGNANKVAQAQEYQLSTTWRLPHRSKLASSINSHAHWGSFAAFNSALTRTFRSRIHYIRLNSDHYTASAAQPHKPCKLLSWFEEQYKYLKFVRLLTSSVVRRLFWQLSDSRLVSPVTSRAVRLFDSQAKNSKLVDKPLMSASESSL